MIQVDLKGYQLLYKKVGSCNNHSARVYVPLSWKNKRVTVVLLEPIDGTDRSTDNRDHQEETDREIFGIL